MIKKWASEFKHGRESLEDNPVREGQSPSPHKIHYFFMAYRRVTERYIANELDISQEHIHEVIHNELQMSKVLAHWVPNLLGPDLKRTRLNMSREFFIILVADPIRFLLRFLTLDETWVHHFQTETKQQLKQWKHIGSPHSKEAKTVISAGKVMASIFCDEEIMHLVDYLDKGRNITGAYCADLLRQLKEKIKQIRRGKLTREILFNQDNAAALTSTVAMTAIQKCGFRHVEHHPILLIWLPLTTIS